MILKALDNISKMNITTITIAHKFLVIKDVDMIYILKDGKIHEKISHDELMKNIGYNYGIIRTRFIRDELDTQNTKEKLEKKKTIYKKVRTSDLVHFVNNEQKEKEISKAPEDIHLGFFTFVKDLWVYYKLDFIFSCLTAIAYGVFPIFNGYIQGECTKALNYDYETKIYDESLKYAIILLILVFGESIFNFLVNWLFFRFGINLAHIYRDQVMKKYLSFHLSFYDLERNYPGTILTNLSSNTVQMKKMFNDIIGTYIISFSIIVTCLIVGCVYEYRLTLIAIGFLIFLLILNFLRKFAKPSDKKQHIRNIDEGTIISETLTNTKTIFAFNFQNKAKELYLEANDYILKKQIISEFIDGIIIGLTLFANFAKNAALFYAAKKYILNDTMD